MQSREFQEDGLWMRFPLAKIEKRVTFAASRITRGIALKSSVTHMELD